MLERRYVIIEQRKHGDEFEDVLKAGTTEKEARAAFVSSWNYLTKKEKEKTIMELVYMATYDGVTLSDDEIEEERAEAYKEAVAKGWDTLAAYNPIMTEGTRE